MAASKHIDSEGWWQHARDGKNQALTQLPTITSGII